MALCRRAAAGAHTAAILLRRPGICDEVLRAADADARSALAVTLPGGSGLSSGE
jgi:hypothetical protein